MKIEINNININYEIYGDGNKNSVLLLHGWGANLKVMESVAKSLSHNFKVYSLDLPGFGESEEPKSDFFVQDYANIVNEFLSKMSLKSCILIGHSFGGRIITVLVGKLNYPAEKIIYVDAASVKPKRHIDYYIKVYSFKLAKKIISLVCSKQKASEIINTLRKNSGSDDYRAVSDNMRKTFINIINEDLTHLFKNINVPTLLIWGENDKDTPISDAKIFEKSIRDSGLVVLKNAGHYSFLDKFSEFMIIVNNFLGGQN